MSARRWWNVEANGRFCGRVEATSEEMREALGPYLDLRQDGLCIVLAPPRKPRKCSLGYDRKTLRGVFLLDGGR